MRLQSKAGTNMIVPAVDLISSGSSSQDGGLWCSDDPGRCCPKKEHDAIGGGCVVHHDHYDVWILSTLVVCFPNEYCDDRTLIVVLNAGKEGIMGLKRSNVWQRYEHFNDSNGSNVLVHQCWVLLMLRPHAGPVTSNDDCDVGQLQQLSLLLYSNSNTQKRRPCHHLRLVLEII